MFKTTFNNTDFIMQLVITAYSSLQWESSHSLRGEVITTRSRASNFLP